MEGFSIVKQNYKAIKELFQLCSVSLPLSQTTDCAQPFGPSYLLFLSNLFSLTELFVTLTQNRDKAVPILQ